MKIKHIHSLLETKQLAEAIAKKAEPDMLLTLSGDLGAGKTTFTKYLGKALGVKKTINSPTFTILKVYYGKMPFYHIDAYRMEGIDQDLGFEEYFDSDGICVIEWPDFIENQLPEERLEIHIKRIDEEEREILLEPKGSRYESLLEDIV